jgi:hypothetical protein
MSESGELRAEMAYVNKIFDAIKTIFEATGGEPIVDEDLVNKIRNLGFGLGDTLCTLSSLSRYGRLGHSYIPRQKVITLVDRTPVAPEDSARFVRDLNARTAHLQKLTRRVQVARNRRT